MNLPIVLLVNIDPKLERSMDEIAEKHQFQLRVARSSQEAFAILSERSREIAFAVMDLDRALHGSAVLAAAASRLPIIVVTSLEEAYARPLTERHGAVACLGRPFDPARLESVIVEQLLKIRPEESLKFAGK